MGNENLTQEEIDALLGSSGKAPPPRPTPVPQEATTNAQDAPKVRVAQFEEFSASQVQPNPVADMDVILDVPLSVSVELGRSRCFVKDLLSLASGSVVELDRAAGEPVDILVNGKLFAKGEVVVIDENFGVRIQEIIRKKGPETGPRKVT